MRRKYERLGLSRLLLGAAVLLLLGASQSPGVAEAQGCGISLSLGISQINYPSGALPPPGSSNLGQILDVNYTAAFSNSTMVLQYLNGTTWEGVGHFTGNEVGFTEISAGLDSSWARFGTNSVRILADGCSSNVATFGVRNDASAYGVDVAVYLALAAFVLAFLLAGRRLGWRRFLLLSVPAYIILSPLTGQRYDVYFLLSSGIRMLQHVNPFDPGSPPLYPGPLKWAYPPLYPLYSALSYLAYQALTGAVLPSVSALTWPGWLTSTYNVYLAYVPSSLPVLVLLLKLPMVASAFLTGALLKKMTGKESSAIWWVANPLVILVAAIWGQLDPISTLLAVGALYYYRQGKESHAYLLASFGAAVKVWPALMIPIMLVASARKRGLRALRPLAGVLPPLLATVFLYAYYGSLLNSLFVFVYARGIPTFAGAFSVNGLTWQQILFVLNSPPLPLFLVAGIPAYAIALLWIYRKGDTDVAKWTVLSVLIFFLTYNYVNPQYFCWILPFLMLRHKKMASVVFTALPLVYVALSYNAFYFASPSILPNYYSLGASIVEQLKLSYFYQTQWLFVLVSGIVPTAAYVLTAIAELEPGWLGRRFRMNRSVLEDEKGLVAKPVEGRNT